MDALRAAIEEAKRDVLKRKTIKQQLQPQADGASNGGAAAANNAIDADAESGERPSKYVRRGDLKRMEREAAATARLQKAQPSSSSAAAAAAASATVTPAAAAAGGSSSSSSSSSSGSGGGGGGGGGGGEGVTARISVWEVKRRLRSLGEPITLFGEDEAARIERLTAAEVRAHERHHSSMGRKDEFKDIAKAVQDELDRALLAEIGGGGGGTDAPADGSGGGAAAGSGAGSRGDGTADGDASGVSADPKDPNAPGNKPLVSEEDKARAKREKAAARLSVDRGRGDFKHAQDYVLHFLKRLLREWEVELDARDDDDKRSAKGKAASAAQKQTRQYVRPLLRLLKERTVADDVLRACERIATLCREREYVAANEVYLTLAIGNAPWPMGVTMVGIHERAGREKIYSQHTAHVLNDETQRKYIQGLKRLMTYCQHKYPTVPSKMVAV